VSNPDPYAHLRNQVGNGPGRIRRRISRISPEPVTEKSVFVREELTEWNGQTFVTEDNRIYLVAACGCLVGSPEDIQSLCPECSESLWVRLRRKKRFICVKHTMCAKCRRRLLLYRRARALSAGILYPLFDVTSDDNDKPY
jgi:hypothetical protein